MVSHNKADIPKGGFGKAPYFHIIGNAFQYKRREYRKTQAAFNHGHNRVVVQRFELDIRNKSAPLEQLGNFSPCSALKQHERTSAKLLDGYRGVLRTRVSLREHRHQLVALQHRGIKVRLYR